MQGLPLERLNAALQKLVKQLTAEQTNDSVEISVIAFPKSNTEAVEVLAEGAAPSQIDHLQLHCAGKSTPMGAAMEQALDLSQELRRRHRAEGLGTWKPIILLITDGKPTDDVSAAKRRIHELDLAVDGAVACYPAFVNTRKDDQQNIDEHEVLQPPQEMEGMFRRAAVGLSVSQIEQLIRWMFSTIANVLNTPSSPAGGSGAPPAAGAGAASNSPKKTGGGDTGSAADCVPRTASLSGARRRSAPFAVWGNP
jgi:uncharacterized protein YegL